MFAITEESSGNLKKIVLANAHTSEFLSIVPAFGANVNELVLGKGGALHSVIAGNRNAEGFAGGGIFRSAKLLPFPNRLKDGAYTFEGKEYCLDLNYPDENNACHGFIYDKPFTIEKSSHQDGSASVTLSCLYDGSLPGYPFKCRISVEYALKSGQGFSCLTRVENLDNKAMPIGDGWHPFFTSQRKVDDLELAFHAQERIEVDDRLIPTGKKYPYDSFDDLKKIGDASFDTCFKLKPSKDALQVTRLRNAEKDIAIILWQETGEGKYNWLQVYTPPDRGSIALEPMSCNVNAFNNLEGLIVLKPGEKFHASYGVKLA